MAEAVVEFDYDAEQEDELTLRVGNVIKNVITAEGGWWEGELNSKKGMFPENFVKLRQAVKKEEKREATQRKSVRELANKFKDGSVPLVGPLPQKKKAEMKAKKCKVLFDYKPENEDELELVVGTLIDFQREVEEGWWEGTVNGRSGVFPSNFVEMVEDGDGEQANDEKNAAGDKDDAFTEIRGKKVMGVGLGNIFGGGPIKLRNTKKPDPGKTKTEEKEAAKPKLPDSQAPDATKRDKQAVERAIVRFSYASEQPDELNLKEGEVIRILDKNLEDEGWWKGEVNGKVGVFPDNFVELLPQEEPVKAPKKPPPPVGKNLYPKLPEKALAVEEKSSAIKKEQEPAPDKSASAAGLKKPVPPPPVGRKPGVPGTALKPPEASTKPDPPKPDPPKVAESAKVEMRSNKGGGSVENNHHSAAATENDKSEGEETSFDVLEMSSQKLMHLTANRAKGPKKRPPSTVLAPGKNRKAKAKFKDIDKSIEEEAPMRGSNHVHAEKPPSRDQKHTSAETERSSYRRHASHDAQHDSVAPPRPPEPTRHHEPHPEASANTAALARLVEDLQREVRDIRSHTVGKNEYNDLRSDYLRLKQDFESFRASTSKKLRELMMEVDDEKKLRLNTQVEMERVKKLLAESHV